MTARFWRSNVCRKGLDETDGCWRLVETFSRSFFCTVHVKKGAPASGDEFADRVDEYQPQTLRPRKKRNRRRPRLRRMTATSDEADEIKERQESDYSKAWARTKRGPRGD
jgi:hypothetical protein